MNILQKISRLWDHSEEKDEICRLYNKLNEICKERDFGKKEFNELETAYCQLLSSYKTDQKELNKLRPKKKKASKAKLKIVTSR
jgi:uncharacterized coiled-coil DUF342 family protein